MDMDAEIEKRVGALKQEAKAKEQKEAIAECKQRQKKELAIMEKFFIGELENPDITQEEVDAFKKLANAFGWDIDPHNPTTEVVEPPEEKTLPEIPREVIERQKKKPTYRRANRREEILKPIGGAVQISNKQMATIRPLEDLISKKLDEIDDPDSGYNKHYAPLEKKYLGMKYILTLGDGREIPYKKVFLSESEIIDAFYMKEGASGSGTTNRAKSMEKRLREIEQTPYQIMETGAAIRLLYFDRYGKFENKNTVAVCVFPMWFDKIRVVGSYTTLAIDTSLKVGDAWREVFGKKMHPENLGALWKLENYLLSHHHFPSQADGQPHRITLFELQKMGIFTDRIIKKRAYREMAKYAESLFKVFDKAGHIAYESKAEITKKSQKDAYDCQFYWHNKPLIPSKKNQ